MKYEHVIFDFDGTIADTGLGVMSGVRFALSKFGINKEISELKEFIGPAFKDVVKEVYGFSQEDADKALKYFRSYYNENGLFQNELYPGVRNLFESLKKAGIKQYIASGKPEPFVIKICKDLEIDGYFDFIAGSDLAEKYTHKPEIIQRVLDNSSITDLNKVIMIGDRKYDVLGAHEKGIKCMGILWGGYTVPGEFEESGADVIASTVEEAQSLLLKD